MAENQPLQEEENKPPTAANSQNHTFWSYFRLPFGRKHKVDKFYRQQSDLLENYENDKQQIRVSVIAQNVSILFFVGRD